VGAPAICSECFRDEGLRLEAQRIGVEDSTVCSNCGASIGRKLDADRLTELAHRFFVWGSLRRCDFGAAPLIQFNQHQETSIAVPCWLKADMRLVERTLGVGFFLYGPRLWMVGEVEPLMALEDPASSAAIIERILQEYPRFILRPEDTFYRIRKAPSSPDQSHEYDSPPVAQAGGGRLDSPGFPVLYASPDLELCVHECRVTAEDDLYVATLSPISTLRLLDLTMLLTHGDATEFESLDMAVHMLFLAGEHSYPIARRIALAAHSAGFDGLVFPSYFSLLRLGVMPFETVCGISLRRFPQARDDEQAKTVPNLAIFGRPIEQSKIRTRCINRLILHRVEYDVHFGPVGCA
jgi:hypothetical protein